jgi:hypothetical protein
MISVRVPVGVEQVGLTFAIHAGLGLDGACVLLAVRLGLESGYGRRNIGHLETKMMGGAAPVGRRSLLGKHELDVVIAVRNLEIDPRQLGFRRAAAPDFGRRPGTAALQVFVNFGGSNTVFVAAVAFRMRVCQVADVSASVAATHSNCRASSRPGEVDRRQRQHGRVRVAGAARDHGQPSSKGRTWQWQNENSDTILTCANCCSLAY